MGFDAMGVAKEISEQEDPAAALWAMLHLVNWEKVRQHVQRHALMQKTGILPGDPCVSLAVLVGVAMGQIPYEGGA